MTYSSNKSIDFIEALEFRDDTIIYNGTYGLTQCIIKQVLINVNCGIPSKVLREITALKNLSHKNIVKLYDIKSGSVVEKDNKLIYCDTKIDSIFLIFEKGHINLTNLSKSSVTTSRAILEDISCGLKYIHDNEYIHGDLSLDNIMAFRKRRSQNLICKMIDFGSATKIYRKSAICTPTFYVAPIEILNENSDIDPQKIDAWSLGCISYYLTTGELLFTSENETSKNMIVKINDTFSSKKSIRKTLVEKSDDIILNKHVVKLINLNKYKRISVSKFYNNIFNDKSANIENVNKQNKHLCNMYDIFEVSGFSEQNCIRSKLIQLFLACNIKNNIPIENIFLTFKLLYKIEKTTEVVYITNAIILFSLTTKLVSSVEILLADTINLIKYMTDINISIDNLIATMLNLLETLNWNIDVESLISHIPKFQKNEKMEYLIISLALLCDNKYDIFKTTYLHKMISLLLNCTKNKKIISIDNIHTATHLLDDMLKSINNMDDDTSMQGKLIKEYLRSVNVDYLLEDLKKINISMLC